MLSWNGKKVDGCSVSIISCMEQQERESVEKSDAVSSWCK